MRCAKIKSVHHEASWQASSSFNNFKLIPNTVVMKHIVVQLDSGVESDLLFLWIEVDCSVGEINGKDRA